MDLVLRAIRAFEDDIGGGESGCNVAALVALRLVPGRDLGVVRNYRQNLVLDLDGAKGIGGLLRGFGGDRGDRFALETAGLSQ